MILYLAADLLWASKIKGVADALGIAARPVRSLDMLNARLADCPVKALVVDLEASEVAKALIARLREVTAGDREKGITILAFGPHVATDALAAAKAAGADTVLARGAFAAKMPEMLQALASGGSLSTSQASE